MTGFDNWDDTHWTPDYIIGYRGWSWNGDYLIGPNNVPWTSAIMEAEHVGGLAGGDHHSSPHPGCYCGINAYKDPIGPRRYNILGKLHLWGIVDEYTAGYRAQYAEIVEIFIYAKYLSTLPPEELSRRMAQAGPFPEEKVDAKMKEIYGVPVTRAKRIEWREKSQRKTRQEQSTWRK